MLEFNVWANYTVPRSNGIVDGWIKIISSDARGSIQKCLTYIESWRGTMEMLGATEFEIRAKVE